MVFIGKKTVVCDRCGKSQEVVCESHEPSQIIVEANRADNLEWEIVERSWSLCGKCAVEYHKLIDKHEKELIEFIGQPRPGKHYW